ncbi:phosphomevalonate kinase-like [Daphnia pulicaria]|uniref:phosphomevalonate kinase-like n=1 Tax=Daphnia pulicaria TaxID=35523 RepID=UPI001EEB9F3B|nr:phosphomevalonate kinase-like [Daphnia pulicaria]
MTINPRRILCLSGKRKSGKDYIAELLHAGIPNSIIIRISAPIKKYWSESKGLDMDKLMSDGAYKEEYRTEMIVWGEEKRAQDSGFFCRTAIEMLKGSDFPVWIVSDLRRETDLKFFRDTYPNRVTCVRISASSEARVKRGFVFAAGVDDTESENGLDHIQDWDVCFQNDGDHLLLQGNLDHLTRICQESL